MLFYASLTIATQNGNPEPCPIPFPPASGRLSGNFIPAESVMASNFSVDRSSLSTRTRKLAAALLATVFLTPALSHGEQAQNTADALPEVRVLTNEGAFEIRLR